MNAVTAAAVQAAQGQSKMAMAMIKEAAEQQRVIANMVAEIAASAPVSSGGRGGILDISV